MLSTPVTERENEMLCISDHPADHLKVVLKDSLCPEGAIHQPRVLILLLLLCLAALFALVIKLCILQDIIQPFAVAAD